MAEIKFDAKGILEELIEDRVEAYAQADEETKKEILKELFSLYDKYDALTESENAAEKTRIEAELKAEMNRLDNETKMAVARIERNTKWLALGAEAIKTGCNIGLEGYRMNLYSAHLGDARRFDASGYSTINSTSSRMANQAAMRVLVK